MSIKRFFKKIHFWFFIGLRYLSARNKKGNIIFFTLFLGITLGLAVLIVVLGIMNGFQENHISRRIEIGSYHIVIFKNDFRSFSLKESYILKNKFYKEYSEIQACIPYADKEVILRTNNKFFNDNQIIKLRACDPDEIIKDEKFKIFFRLSNKEFKLDEYSIIPGSEMFNHLLIDINDDVYLTPDITLRSLRNTGVPFRIYDTFKTNSYDYDRHWVFMSIYSLLPLTGKIELDGIGIKLKNINKQKKIYLKLKKELGKDYFIQTAQDINRGYFTALKLEKTMIIFLFLIIFVMVGANIFGALKLTIIEKNQDIAIIKSIGASPADIEIIYIIESLILGFGGSLTGVITGLLLAYNISNIFMFIETIINNLIFIIGLNIGQVKIYDSSIYYQQGFPVKLSFYEIFITCTVIIIMVLLASLMPVIKASKQKPANIIKN